MNEFLRDIPEWLWVAIIGGVTSISLWWRRQASGISFFSEATDEQRDKLEEIMRERIDFLDQRVEYLEEQNDLFRDALNCGDRGPDDGTG